LKKEKTLKVAALFFLGVLIFSCTLHHPGTPADNTAGPDSTIVKPEPDNNLKYGIPCDSFDVISGRIKPNGYLSEVLLRYGVTMNEIDQLIKNSSQVFDLRKIRANSNYALLCDRDSSARLRYVLYEHDRLTNYLISFNDSLNITPFRKEVRKVIRYSEGIIETSLWESMMKDSLHTSLAISLSDIYAWTVDFFGLQKGDGFSVIYEEIYIDSIVIGTGRIFGARFSWNGNDIYAIPYIQDGRESYFDQDGNSLRKAFLKAPLTFSRISSRFSSSRLHPILRIRRPHYGVDYAAPVGTPVHSIGDGKVVFAGTDGGAGRMVRITHNSVYSTAYLHLSRYGPGINAGVSVTQGQVIGYVGSSGLSTGPHLDFRVYKNGSPIDPLTMEAPPVEPVAEQNLPAFEKSRKVVLSLLETIL